MQSLYARIILFCFTLIHAQVLPFLEQNRAEQSRAVAYCRQPASTVTPGIEPRWDPWPYICSMSRLLFFSPFFRCSSFDIYIITKFNNVHHDRVDSTAS
jgi:hypothetical protein